MYIKTNAKQMWEYANMQIPKESGQVVQIGLRKQLRMRNERGKSDFSLSADRQAIVEMTKYDPTSPMPGRETRLRQDYGGEAKINLRFQQTRLFFS